MGTWNHFVSEQRGMLTIVRTVCNPGRYGWQTYGQHYIIMSCPLVKCTYSAPDENPALWGME